MKGKLDKCALYILMEKVHNVLSLWHPISVNLGCRFRKSEWLKFGLRKPPYRLYNYRGTTIAYFSFTEPGLSDLNALAWQSKFKTPTRWKNYHESYNLMVNTSQNMFSMVELLVNDIVNKKIKVHQIIEAKKSNYYFYNFLVSLKNKVTKRAAYLWAEVVKLVLLILQRKGCARFAPMAARGRKARSEVTYRQKWTYENLKNIVSAKLCYLYNKSDRRGSVSKESKRLANIFFDRFKMSPYNLPIHSKEKRIGISKVNNFTQDLKIGAPAVGSALDEHPTALELRVEGHKEEMREIGSLINNLAAESGLASIFSEALANSNFDYNELNINLIKI